MGEIKIIDALDTRLDMPRLRPERVRRPRLIGLLEDASQSGLICVRAPAGFGKTTVVADWLMTTKRPFAWIGVEKEVSAEGFLVRVEAAVAYALRSEGRSTRSPDREGEDDDDPVLSELPFSDEAALLSVAARIMDSGLPLALVVDDYHALTDEEAPRLMSRLCELLPPGSCLVAIGREALDCPRARLRARGELVEIGVDELRFTPSETREFLSRSSLPRLSDEEVLVLAERTEGWVAGLQLAVLALRRDRDPGHFLNDFSGTSRDVYDFLTEEALNALPVADLDFLGSISVLDRFCAPLSAFLAGRRDARELLGRLEDECLFIIPLDGERGWYRFHTLFREALLGRLRGLDPGRERELRLKASAWFADNGQEAEALRQAVLAGDPERVGVLSEDYALALLESGDVGELRRGFESLGRTGREVGAGGPWFNVAAGWAAAYAGDLELALSRAEAALAAFPEASALLAASMEGLDEPFRGSSSGQDDSEERFAEVSRRAAELAARSSPACRRLAGQVEALRAYVAWLSSTATVGTERSLRALALIPETDLMARAHAEMSLASCLYKLASYDRSEAVYREAMESAGKAGSRYIRELAAEGLTNLLYSKGELDRAKVLCLDIAAESGAESNPALGGVMGVLSSIEWERDEIGAALEAGRKALEFAKRWNQADNLVNAYTALATALSAAGESEAALELLSRAKGLESVSAWHKLNLEEAAASIELERGNRAGADDFCSRPQPIGTYEGAYTLAHWLILRHRPAEALAALRPRYERAKDKAILPRLAEACVLMALAEKARGDRQAALARIDEAVEISAPGGYIRRFVRRGEGVAELLGERQAIRPEPFVDRLLEAFSADARRKSSRRKEGSQASPRGEASVEELSSRELEVLRLLGEGFTAEEIAGKAFVAPSTIRSHVKSIYGKLGVHRRVEALRRANELGLL